MDSLALTLALLMTSEARLAVATIFFRFLQEITRHIRPSRLNKTINVMPMVVACQALTLTFVMVMSVVFHHGESGTFSPSQLVITPPEGGGKLFT